jgi:hypothetical protein
MRRLEQGMPMPSKVAMALIVREDEQDVWLGRLCRTVNHGDEG